jgi:glutathione S-transferase
MKKHSFGHLWPVSTLTLGGGGLGMVWGATTFDECVATVHEAVAAGINLFDLAPRYGDGKAEEVVGEAFAGRLPDGVRVTSKCGLGEQPPTEIEGILRRSIEGSLKRLRLQSAAILEYLAESLGQFTATGDQDRQHVREWLFWDADRLMPPLYSWYSIELGRRGLLPLSFDPVLVADFDQKGQAALTVLDGHLANCQFLVGHTATIADICCFADIAFAQQQGPYRLVEGRGVDGSDRGAIRFRRTVRSSRHAGRRDYAVAETAV